MAPEPFPRNEKNRCPPVLVQLVGTPIPKKGRASGEATLDATRAGESSLRPGVEQAWSKMMQKSIYIIYIYIYIYVEEALSGIGLMSTFRSATIYIYIYTV